MHQAHVDVVYPVEWPDGWSVGEEAGILQLVDGTGQVVGADGDHFSAGGGFTAGPDEAFQPCPSRDRAGQRVSRAAALLLATVVLTACIGPFAEQGQSSAPNRGGGLQGTPEECPAALLEGELLRDDGDGFIVQHEDGFVTPVVWPEGYSVRDAETRELVDLSGAVVAREGDFVALGGGMDPTDSAFIVCGPFTVTPR